MKINFLPLIKKKCISDLLKWVLDHIGIVLKVDGKINCFCYIVVSFDQSFSVLFIENAWTCLLLARRQLWFQNDIHICVKYFAEVKVSTFWKEYCSLCSQLWALRSHIKNSANWSGVIIIISKKNTRQNFRIAVWAGVVQVYRTDLQTLKQQSYNWRKLQPQLAYIITRCLHLMSQADPWIWPGKDVLPPGKITWG